MLYFHYLILCSIYYKVCCINYSPLSIIKINYIFDHVWFIVAKPHKVRNRAWTAHWFVSKPSFKNKKFLMPKKQTNVKIPNWTWQHLQPVWPFPSLYSFICYILCKIRKHNMLQPEVGTRIGLPDWIAIVYWIVLDWIKF